jgi:hypothetical protein
VTIFAAAISTLLTALAALWGQQLTRWFTDTFGTATDGWRMLCTLAAACSLTAGVAAQLQTSKNYEERLAQAQEIMASLEALEVAITLGHLNQMRPPASTSKSSRALRSCTRRANGAAPVRCDSPGVHESRWPPQTPQFLCVVRLYFGRR